LHGNFFYGNEKLLTCSSSLCTKITKKIKQINSVLNFNKLRILLLLWFFTGTAFTFDDHASLSLKDRGDIILYAKLEKGLICD